MSGSDVRAPGRRKGEYVFKRVTDYSVPQRIRRLKEAIKKYHAEGVVFHTLRGCQLNTIEGTKIEVVLDGMGIPMLKLESEYVEGDIEQIRARAEAFVEMIKARRSTRGM